MQQATAATATPAPSRLRPRRRAWRRLATAAAVAASLLFAYFAVCGHNGILGYSSKRMEDRVLAAEIKRLGEENSRLQNHVDHLQNDPAAVEHEAREQLHYARPGEVIYTLDEPRAGAPNPSPNPSH